MNYLLNNSVSEIRDLEGLAKSSDIDSFQDYLIVGAENNEQSVKNG